MNEFSDLLLEVLDDYFVRNPDALTATSLSSEAFRHGWDALRKALAEGVTDVGQPGFAAQMVAPPHVAALAGYFAAQLLNPNNHDHRHAAATVAMERDVIGQMAAMLGLAPSAQGHLTSGGAIANLEGLWTGRQHRPQGAVAFSEDAHFVHERNCRLMGASVEVIDCDASGRMRLDALETALRRGHIGTVIASVGTPGLGAVDPLHELVALRHRYEFAIHVDASYGGFFSLLRDEAGWVDAAAFSALSGCQSIAIDPHKLGLQPYGCGCVIYPDTAEPGFAQRSPYTDGAARSGLECSRPGAAAAALWLTLKVTPLHGEHGFGPQLKAMLSAARHFAALIASEAMFALVCPPELGIVAFRPGREISRPDEISATCRRMIDLLERRGIDLSLLRIRPCRIGVTSVAREADVSGMSEVSVLRSVFMKPNQQDYVPTMYQAIKSACRGDGIPRVSGAFETS